MDFHKAEKDFSELAGREIWQIVSAAATSHAPVSIPRGAADSHLDFLASSTEK